MSSASDEPRPGASEPASDGRLDSWKEIAAHLRRSVRSAKRWEKEEGLPVHRHLHGKRDSVYAYKPELDVWWKSRGTTLGDRNAAEECAAVSEEPQQAEPPESEISAPSGTSRTTAIVVAGLFVALLIAAAWVSQRNSRAARQRTPLPFQSRDWVLVAGFENRTGQSLLDGSLEYALQRELSNSRYVNVVPRERIGDALRLMRKPLDTRVDAAIGREICLRDGEIRALITGRVEKFGSKYVLSVQLADPNRGGSTASASAEASSEEQLLPAARRVSDELRAMLGEKPPSIQQARDKLLKVTTPSLRALQLYSLADGLLPWNGPAAEELLKQAVAEDPEFASAHIHLAFAIRNQGRPERDWLPHAETAFRLSATTTEREQWFIRGSYYLMSGQDERAIAAYEALRAHYPDHFWATSNLANLYETHGRLQNAVEMSARRADLRPNDFLANFVAAESVVTLDRVRSRIYVRRARELASPTDLEESPFQVARMELMPAAELWLDGNLTQVLQAADGLAARINSLSSPAQEAFAQQVCPVYLELGRFDAAARSALKVSDPYLRHDLLARVAFFRDDPGELKQHLEASEKGARRAPDGQVSLLARAGLLSQAARLLARFEECCAKKAYVQILRGEVALARGEVSKGLSELEDGTARMGEGLPYFFLGSDSLATALERKGDLSGAVRVLERASARRPAAAFHFGGSYWLRTRFQLAHLYRETGREKDARPIEEELRKLLALADPGHPIRRELDRLKGS